MAGNAATQSSVTLGKDIMVPTVSDVTSSTADGSYTLGQVSPLMFSLVRLSMSPTTAISL